MENHDHHDRRKVADEPEDEGTEASFKRAMLRASQLIPTGPNDIGRIENSQDNPECANLLVEERFIHPEADYLFSLFPEQADQDNHTGKE